MTARPRLDRKTRWTVGLIVVMILALPVLAVHSYVSRVTAENVTLMPSQVDERFVAIDGRKMLVEPEDLGQAMKDWLGAAKEKSFEFELSDKSFAVDSAEPSSTTVTRVSQLVQLTRAYPPLMVHILLPRFAETRAIRQLDQQRAERLHDELVTHGIGESQVTVGDETDDLPTAKSPQIAVLLLKTKGSAT